MVAETIFAVGMSSPQVLGQGCTAVHYGVREDPRDLAASLLPCVPAREAPTARAPPALAPAEHAEDVEMQSSEDEGSDFDEEGEQLVEADLVEMCSQLRREGKQLEGLCALREEANLELYGTLRGLWDHLFLGADPEQKTAGGADAAAQAAAAASGANERPEQPAWALPAAMDGANLEELNAFIQALDAEMARRRVPGQQ